MSLSQHSESKIELSAEDTKKADALKERILRAQAAMKENLSREEERAELAGKEAEEFAEISETLKGEIEKTKKAIAHQKKLLSKNKTEQQKNKDDLTLLNIETSNQNSKGYKKAKKLILDQKADLEAQKAKTTNTIEEQNHYLKSLENQLDEVESNSKIALNKLGEFIPVIYNTHLVLSTCYVLTDLVYSAYALQLCGGSIDSLINAWDPQYVKAADPSQQNPAALSWAIGGPLAGFDMGLNVLLIAPADVAREETKKHFEKYKLKGFLPTLKQELAEKFKFALTHPVQALFASLNSFVKSTHNYIGAAADAVGLNQYFKPDFSELSARSVGTGILYAFLLKMGDGYYSKTQDGKYDKGHDIFKQIATIPKRAFIEGEYSLTMNTVIRLLSSAGIRGLNFAFLAKQIGNLGSKMAWLDATSPLAGAIVFYHTLRVRGGNEFAANFGNKDKLVDLIAEGMLTREVEKLKNADPLIKALEGLKNGKGKSLDSNGEMNEYATLLVENLLKAITENSNPSTETREAVIECLINMQVASFGDQALINATGTKLHELPETVRLNPTALTAELHKRLLEKAKPDAELVRKHMREAILSERSYKDQFLNFLSNAGVASLRGAFAGILGHQVLYKGPVAIVNALGIDDPIANTLVQYSTDVIVGALAFMVYHRAETNRKIDEEIVDTFSQKNNLEAKPFEKVEQETKTFFQKIKAALNQQNTAKALSILFTFGSSLMRDLSQIEPIADPFIGLMDQKLLMVGVTLLCTEASFNNYFLWQKDVENTLKSHLEAITTWLKTKKEAKNKVSTKAKEKANVNAPDLAESLLSEKTSRSSSTSSIPSTLGREGSTDKLMGSLDRDERGLGDDDEDNLSEIQVDKLSQFEEQKSNSTQTASTVSTPILTPVSSWNLIGRYRNYQATNKAKALAEKEKAWNLYETQVGERANRWSDYHQKAQNDKSPAAKLNFFVTKAAKSIDQAEQAQSSISSSPVVKK